MVARNAAGAENKEKAEPSESEGPKRTVLSKISLSTSIVLAIYVFVLTGALLVASVHFINFTTSNGGSETIKGDIPILVPANETRIVQIMLTDAVHGSSRDNDTWIYGVDPLFKKDTAWNGILFYMDLETRNWSQTISFGISATYPDGHNDTYSYEGVISGSVVLSSAFNATLGLYSVEVRNVGRTDLNGSLKANLVEQIFEKPYFYYGWMGLYISIAGLIISIVYSALHVFEFSRSWFRRTRF
jgi:ABC-type glycerol-3-phosphate transport system permease component